MHFSHLEYNVPHLTGTEFGKLHLLQSIKDIVLVSVFLLGNTEYKAGKFVPEVAADVSFFSENWATCLPSAVVSNKTVIISGILGANWAIFLRFGGLQVWYIRFIGPVDVSLFIFNTVIGVNVLSFVGFNRLFWLFCKFWLLLPAWLVVLWLAKLIGDRVETVPLAGDMIKAVPLAGNMTEAVTLAGNMAEAVSLAGDIAAAVLLAGDIAEAVLLAGDIAEVVTLDKGLPANANEESVWNGSYFDGNSMLESVARIGKPLCRWASFRTCFCNHQYLFV